MPLALLGQFCEPDLRALFAHVTGVRVAAPRRVVVLGRRPQGLVPGRLVCMRIGSHFVHHLRKKEWLSNVLCLHTLSRWLDIWD